MLKPLSTQNRVTVQDLINLVKERDVPHNAVLTLKHKPDGTPYLFAYWSEGPGAFGETLINFDAEFKFESLKTMALNSTKKENPFI